jgi:hypothetical protein
MSLSSWQRRCMLAGGAGLALLAAVYAGPARDVIQPADPARTSAAGERRQAAHKEASTAPAAGNDVDVARARERLQTHARTEPIKDAFAPRSWAPPQPEPAPFAPPPQAESAPSATVAPPLPYQYLGQLSEQGRTLVFLARGETPVMGGVGEILDGTYRIERIAATAVEFTYLPLNTRQLLAVGGVQ